MLGANADFLYWRLSRYYFFHYLSILSTIDVKKRRRSIVNQPSERQPTCCRPYVTFCYAPATSRGVGLNSSEKDASVS